MIDLNEVFSGSRVTQVGLGLLGRGIGDARTLARYGAQLVVTDQKTEQDLSESIERLADVPGITYRLGGHDAGDFEDRDLVLKGAGVPLDSPYIAHARAHGVPVDMSASLFMRIAGIPCIGVTGTRGKSTTTAMIAAILRADGQSPLLGGNVRGVSNLELLEQVTDRSMGVFELDSWQCQGFGEERSLARSSVRQGPFSPSVAVFTTFMEDHLNYYHGDIDRYLEDKAHIFLYQQEGDVLVVGTQARDALKRYRKGMRGHVLFADAQDIPTDCTLKVVGEHNLYLAGIAAATGRALGVSDEMIKRALESFQPLEGRLQFVRTIRGVHVYNDNNATTPEATAAALRALDPDGSKRVILLAGGADKGLDPMPIISAAREHAKAIVLLSGSGTDKLLPLCDGLFILQADTLQDAAQKGCDIAEEGDVAVFSPGFASFGMFKNEYDRGDQFLHLVSSM